MKTVVALGLVVATQLMLAVPSCAAWPAPRLLDTERLESAGLRVIESKHATLVTDISASSAVDALPNLIDRGVPQWADRFSVNKRRTGDWRLRVYLIEDESKFRSLNLWPDKNADFPHALSLGYEVWIRRQNADYYQRHLLVHEATHSFMSTLLGSCGPGWYMEGIAELCGTHSWDGDKLQLAVMPASRDAARDWGRIRLVRESVADSKLLSSDAVRKIDNRAILPAQSYAWVWSLCHFLDNHPAYRARFRKMPRWVNSNDFDRRFKRTYSKDRQQLEKEWRLFASTLVYGHDLEREAISFKDRSSKNVSSQDRSSQQATIRGGNGSQPIKIQADRGWQSSGIVVKAGQAYQIAASGHFVIGQEPDGTPWPCEAGGITLQYHAGRPIGQLLATVDRGSGAFVESAAIRPGSDYRPPASGTLYLRVNDSPACLADNAGELAVTVALAVATPAAVD